MSPHLVSRTGAARFVLPILASALLSGGPLLGSDPTSIPAKGCILPAVNAADAGPEVVKYKSYTRAVLMPIWDREMRTNESSLWFGKVSIHCTVHSDGSLSDLALTVGETTGLMKTVCRQALLDSAPFKPFSAALLKQVGASYPDDFVFNVTRGDSSVPVRTNLAPNETD